MNYRLFPTAVLAQTVCDWLAVRSQYPKGNTLRVCEPILHPDGPANSKALVADGEYYCHLKKDITTIGERLTAAPTTISVGEIKTRAECEALGFFPPASYP